MPTDLPPDYKPNPNPVDPGAGKGVPGVPDPGQDLRDPGAIVEPAGDAIDPSISEPRPAPAGMPTF